MIVRIMGEGQLEVDDGELEALNSLDGALQSAVDSGTEEDYRAALQALLHRVKAIGRAVPDEELRPSDIVLPGPDIEVDELRQLLGDEGLIPG